MNINDPPEENSMEELDVLAFREQMFSSFISELLPYMTSRLSRLNIEIIKSLYNNDAAPLKSQFQEFYKKGVLE